ncbi:MAG: hypothetical protein HY909_05105 [Deltaproteobacteria bacterium]|nr:hypothetical protein [Deltaproteobacteria bacterium]
MRRSLVLSLVAALAVAPRGALAQAAQPTPDPAQLLAEGTQDFANNRYRSALERFQRVFDITGNPALLFNISLCWQRMGEPGEAARALRRYLLASPTLPERPRLEAQLQELEAQDRQLHPTATPPPPPPTATTPATTPPTTAPGVTPAPGHAVGPFQRLPAAWLLGAGGVAVTATGVAFLVLGASNAASAEAAGQESAYLQARDRFGTYNVVGGVLLGVGALAVVGAAVWFGLSTPSTRERSGLTARPYLALEPDGLRGLGLAGRW